MPEFQPGDTVTVTGIIATIAPRGAGQGDIGVKFERDSLRAASVWVAKTAIATHTPKPFDFQPDDVVSFEDGGISSRGSVVAAVGDKLWLTRNGADLIVERSTCELVRRPHNA